MALRGPDVPYPCHQLIDDDFFSIVNSANLPAMEHRWWWRGALESTGPPPHTYPFPILAFKTRFIFPFQSAEHQVVLRLVSSYLDLHSFQLFSLGWGWEIGIGEAVRQGTYRMTGLVVRWELGGSFTPRSHKVSLGREEMFLFSTS